MSKLIRSVVALSALGAGVQAASAQTPAGRDAGLRTLLARAESLAAGIAREDSVAREAQHRERLATRFDAGAVTVILPASVGDATGRRFVEGAARILDSAGVIPASFIATRIVVAYAADGVDSLVRAARLDKRVRIGADISAAPDTLADGLLAADVLAQSFRGTLDPEWRKWLPSDMGMGWNMRIEGAEAVRQLMAGETRVGALCLGGSAAGCRLWLGLDRGAMPYQAAEIRKLLTARWPGNRGVASQCVGGSDDACETLVRDSLLIPPIPPVPAGAASRGSFLRAVRRLHGDGALRVALADTAGPVGDRLARASHVSEDSLVTEWRSWLLTGGGQPRVTADLRDAVPAALAAALLLLAAARTGRWR